MGYKEISYEIGRELHKKSVDWDRIAGLIRSLGSDINNLIDDEDTILSDLMLGLGRGDKAIKLVRLFLDNGFDVKANDGFNGFSCMYELCWSFYDHRVLHVAEMLIDAGTDCNHLHKYDENDEEEGILDAISFKCYEWMTGDYDNANIYDAYYLMVDRAGKGQEYRGIRAFDDARGLCVTGVERIRKNGGTLDDDDIGDGLILWCDKTPLVISPSVDCMINPYILDDVETEDVSDKYAEIIGKTIKSLLYKSSSCARLYFAESKYLLFNSTYYFGNKKKRQTYCVVKDTGGKYLIKEDQNIYSIRFDSSFTLAASTCLLTCTNMYLDMGDRLLHISSNNINYGENEHFIVDEIPQKWGKGLTRYLDVGPAVVQDTVYKGNMLTFLGLRIGDRHIVLTPHFDSVEGQIINNDQLECITLRDTHVFRYLRLLLPSHPSWNDIEIRENKGQIEYVICWKEINKEQHFPTPYINKPISGTSRLSMVEFDQKLDNIGFDSWLRPDNVRASKHDEVVWWLFYDDGQGILKERDHLDQPQISQEQFDAFVAILEEVVD